MRDLDEGGRDADELGRHLLPDNFCRHCCGVALDGPEQKVVL
jgi:hypothetical protein